MDGIQPAIWQMKGYIHNFDMRYRRLISIHRLQRKINFGPLTFSSLVVFTRMFWHNVWYRCASYRSLTYINPSYKMDISIVAFNVDWRDRLSECIDDIHIHTKICPNLTRRVLDKGRMGKMDGKWRCNGTSCFPVIIRLFYPRGYSCEVVHWDRDPRTA